MACLMAPQLHPGQRAQTAAQYAQNEQCAFRDPDLVPLRPALVQSNQKECQKIEARKPEGKCRCRQVWEFCLCGVKNAHHLPPLMEWHHAIRIAVRVQGYDQN